MLLFFRRIAMNIRSYLHGLHGVNKEIGGSEIDPLFGGKQERCLQKSAGRLAKLEAKVETNQQHRNDAKREKDKLESLVEGMPPPVTKALLALSIALLALAGEAIFLSPVLDGMGIADKQEQMVFAFVLVFAASGLIEIVCHQFTGALRVNFEPTDSSEPQNARGQSVLGMAITLFLTVLSFATIGSLGLFRAAELIYRAKLNSGQSNPLMVFMQNHSTLAQTTICLVTVALPVMAAIAFSYGIGGLHLAFARWRYRRFSWKHNLAVKRAEKHEEIQNGKIAQLGKQREEWKRIYDQNREWAAKLRAQRLPMLILVLRLVSVVSLVLLACLWLDDVISEYTPSETKRWLIYFLAVITIGGRYAAHLFKVNGSFAQHPRQEQIDDWQDGFVGEDEFATQMANPHDGFQSSPRHRRLLRNLRASKNGSLAMLIGLSAFLSGCQASCLTNRQAQKPLRLGVIWDGSGSIKAVAMDPARLSIQNDIFKPSGRHDRFFEHLDRGDEVFVIPITADALTDGQGNTLRFPLNKNRDPYDSDLRRLSEEISRKLQTQWEKFAAEPTPKSDLLGAVRQAAEEFAQSGHKERHGLILFTDLIEDTIRYQFKTDPRLAEADSARKLAEELAQKLARELSSEPTEPALPFANTVVFVGLLQSKDLQEVDDARRTAIQEFWKTYFNKSGAASITTVTDGSGQLPKFLARLSEKDSQKEERVSK